uniref:Calbindin 2 n=1 Tax=Eptatretus burgeri TaxID=7764 RepID=A0A8C4R503_EPTBU
MPQRGEPSSDSHTSPLKTFSRFGTTMTVTESGEESMKTFMDKYDKNSDGRIELAELAQILPTEENFLLFFRQHVRSSTEFMEAWRHYDSDRSGYIESDELKDFLRDLLKKANREFDEEKLEEYTQTTVSFFIFIADVISFAS